MLTMFVLFLVGLALLVVLTEAFLETVMAAFEDRRDAALVRARIAARHQGGAWEQG